MSKSMGFRNSGKLDIGDKGVEYALVAVLVIVIVVAGIFVVKQIWGGGGSVPVEAPDEYHVKCVQCNAEWTIKSKDAKFFNREVEMGGVDCDKCGGKGCVFLMKRCPACKKYYLSKRVTDPDAFARDGHREICPHCGKSLYEWHKEHPRRR